MKINGITPRPTDDPRVFELPSAPNPPESLMLFRNGVLQHPGLEFELNVSPTNSQSCMVVVSDPRRDDLLRAWYEI